MKTEKNSFEKNKYLSNKGIRPRISVVIAASNNAEHIGECLDSILSQPFSEIEVIVVDVLSTDGTKDLVAETAREDARVVFLADSYASLGRARNIGMDHARAPYIVFVEPEDYIDGDMLGYLYREMEENPGLDMATCEVDSFGNGSFGETNRDKNRRIREANRAGGNKLQMDSRVFRFHAFESAGIYRKSFLDEKEIRFYDVPGYGRQDAAFRFLTMLWSRPMVSDSVLYFRRMDVLDHPVTDTRHVFDVCNEYRFLRERLKEDKNGWWRIRFVFWQAYYISNMELYRQLSDDLMPLLSKRMQGDLLEAVRRKELNRDNLDILTKDEIELLFKSVKDFDEYQRNRIKEQNKERSKNLSLNARIAKRSQEKYEVGNCQVSRSQTCEWRTNKAEEPSSRGISNAQAAPAAVSAQDTWADTNTVERLSRRWLLEEMRRDLAPLRLLLGMSQEEMGNLLGVSGSAYKSLEAGKKEVSWDQYLALLFLFRCNDRTAAVTETLGLYPESLKLRIKKGIVGNIVAG